MEILCDTIFGQYILKGLLSYMIHLLSSIDSVYLCSIILQMVANFTKEKGWGNFCKQGAILFSAHPANGSFEFYKQKRKVK